MIQFPPLQGRRRFHFSKLLVGFAVLAVMCVPIAARTEDMPTVPPGLPPHTGNVILAIGDNEHGQLGIPDLPFTPTFTPASAFGADVVAIKGTEGNFSIVLKADGSVWACGENTFKQIGEGDVMQDVPVKIADLTDVIAIDGGVSHGLALKADGTVWSWGGAEGWYLFGDSKTARVSTPRQIKGLTDITAIAAGNCHSLALRKDGTVWAWGLWGELLPFSWEAMHQMKSLPTIKMIAAGGQSMALANDGSVWTWGGNDKGQLGDGTTKNRNIPAQVPGLTGVVSIAAGSRSSYAIKEDGTVWAWGGNGNNQLGDGTTRDRLTPVQVPGLTNVKVVSASYYGGIALTTTGDVWLWGCHKSVPRYTIPQQITDLKNVTSVSDGVNWALVLQNNKQ